MSISSNLGPVCSNNSVLCNSLSRSLDRISFGHINCQSIKPSSSSTKLDELKTIMSGSPLSIVGITESWLKPFVTDNAVNIPGYNICRNDRLVGRGGGVAFYVADSIKFEIVFSCSVPNLCESLFIRIIGNNMNLVAGVIYLPNGNFNSIEEQLSDFLVRHSNVVIMGDFNYNMFDVNKSSRVRSFCNMYNLSCFHNSSPTYFDPVHNNTSLLDFFMCSNNNFVYASGQFLCPGISRHAFIFGQIGFTSQCVDSSFTVFNYNAINYELIRDKIHNSNIYDVFSLTDVNQQVVVLTTILTDLLNTVPKKVCRQLKTKDFYTSREATYARSLRDLAYKAYLNNRTDDNWKTFCYHRNRLKNLLRKLKRSDGCRLFEGKTTKQIWSVLRDSGAQESDSASVSFDACGLNEYFLAHQNSRLRGGNYFVIPDRADGFSFRNINIDELFGYIMSIKSNAVGCDGIPIKFLKLIFPLISNVLLFVINNILTTSIFPEAWKIARVVPIKKKGSSMEFNNLRPISVLPALSKIVEATMKRQIVDYVEEQCLLNDRQSAYRNGHNTTSLLLSLTDLIRKNTLPENFSVLVSLDLTKAFDSIDKFIMNNKLFYRYNFSTPACKMIKSYLDNRQQFVQYKDFRSETLNVECGVPQGSVIGPILFMLFINDFFECLDQSFCDTFIFADDIQILFKGQLCSFSSMETFINDCLRKIDVWMFENKLLVNVGKTKAMLFKSPRAQDLCLNLYMNNILVEFVSEMKCLGVIIDENLTFESHINALCSSINYTLIRLYSLNIYLPSNIRKTIANSLLMSRLLYAMEVYSSTTDGRLNKVRLLINRVARFVYNLKLSDHVSRYVVELVGLTTDNFIVTRLLLFFYRVMYLQAPGYLVELFSFSRSIRNPQLLISAINSSSFERSFEIRVARSWNSLPVALKCFSFTPMTFKRRLILYLNNN